MSITIHTHYSSAVQAIVGESRHRFEVNPVGGVRRTCERIVDACPSDHPHEIMIAQLVSALMAGDNKVCADAVMVVQDGEILGNKGIIISQYSEESEPLRFVAIQDGIRARAGA